MVLGFSRTSNAGFSLHLLAAMISRCNFVVEAVD